MMLLQTGLYHLSRNWVPVQMVGLSMSIFAAIGVYLLPESPKFYYATHRYDSARKMIKLVSNYNQIELKDEDVKGIIFDTEEQLKLAIEANENFNSNLEILLNNTKTSYQKEVIESEKKMRLLRMQQVKVGEQVVMSNSLG